MILNRITNKKMVLDKLKKPKPKRKYSSVEKKHCHALIRWRNTQKLFDPKLLFHIPNEGKRAKWVSKPMGIEAGVSDYFLMIPKNKYSGLWIEMKEEGKKPTPKQKEFLERAKKIGYAVAVCFTWREAVEVIKNYLFYVEHKL